MVRVFDMLRHPDHGLPMTEEPERRDPWEKLPTDKRFEYSRMSGKELAQELVALQMTPVAFSRIFGVNGRTLKHWLTDRQDIPPWVWIAVNLLQLRDAPRMAREAAANHILRDLHHPGKGEFPYLEQPFDEKEDS